MSTSSAAREERFRALYRATYDQLLRFARRRMSPDRRASAEDVVAEAFLIAWRRLDDVPTREGEALAWMYAVTRNCLLNAHRSGQRQDALDVRITALPQSLDSVALAADEVSVRVDLAAAWQRLTPEDQEALALAIFEDLTSRRAAQVLGITAAAYRMRLSRARRALRRHLNDTPSRSSAKPNRSNPILQEDIR